MDAFSNHWYDTPAHANDFLDQKLGGKSMCDYWAMRVFLASFFSFFFFLSRFYVYLQPFGL